MSKSKNIEDRMEAYSDAIQRINESEKRFEEYIENYLISDEGGWTKATDAGYRSEESRWYGDALSVCVPSVLSISFIRRLKMLLRRTA